MYAAIVATILMSIFGDILLTTKATRSEFGHLNRIFFPRRKKLWIKENIEKQNANRSSGGEADERRSGNRRCVVVVAVRTLETAADFANVQVFQADRIVYPHGGNHRLVIIIHFDFVPLTHVGHGEPSLYVELDLGPSPIQIFEVEKNFL